TPPVTAFHLAARAGGFVPFGAGPPAGAAAAAVGPRNRRAPRRTPRHLFPLRALRDRHRAPRLPPPQPFRRREPPLRPPRHLARLQRQAADAPGRAHLHGEDRVQARRAAAGDAPPPPPRPCPA